LRFNGKRRFERGSKKEGWKEEHFERVRNTDKHLKGLIHLCI
jgi:hypothetical protein